MKATSLTFPAFLPTLLLGIMLPVGSAFAQQPEALWSELSAPAAAQAGKTAWVQPVVHRAQRLNVGAMRSVLARAPHERSAHSKAERPVLFLPMPEGGLQRFRIVEAPVMAPELAAKFPQIKTYLGQGVDDPRAVLRCDLTPAGFHAQIIRPGGWVYIDPRWRDDATEYAVYLKRDLPRGEDFICLTPSPTQPITTLRDPTLDMLTSGPTLRTYRLALACTVEYAAFHGGTVPSALAAMVTSVNRVVGVYETELAIRLVLVANNNLLVYTTSPDPYSNTSGSTMLGQNQSNVDAVIGNANYDIGHVFSTGGGGIASLGCVCLTGLKAQGVTGRGSPVGDAFDIDYVAHEIGHQFGGNHTFNSTTANCGGGNRNASTAYEPGSGTTIMAYAGICDTDNTQLNSDPFFHFISFEEIIALVTGSATCSSNSATGNTTPTINAGLNYVIPVSTPFALTAAGSDLDGDPLTYCWEQRDLGAAQTIGAADNGLSPLFRSFPPTNSPTRTFPKLSALLANTTSLGEKLPTVARTMKFRVTARDNQAGGGGVASADMQLTVDASAGPFVVTTPNTATNWSGARTVNWNVAGTAVGAVNCANVNILLSTNGGNTFPFVLATNTPNDGSQTVVLPNLNTATARIKVEGAGNVFFDISNTNFTIVPGVPTPLIVLDPSLLTVEACAPGNGVIDPGESVTVNFTLRNLGTAPTTTLVATLRTNTGVSMPGSPQNYGAIAPGAAATSAFTFLANGTCGGSIQCVFDLLDGTNNHGSVTSTFTLGSTTSNVMNRTNLTALTIPGGNPKGPASVYPSAISVSNFTGTVTKVTVTLSNFTHTFPDDVDILLVGPGGQKVMLMSDAGTGNNITNVTLTFDDNAAGGLPDSATIMPGTYTPTDFTVGETMTAPAPGGPYGSSLAAFNGVNPNGAWSLYVEDDSNQDSGSLGGWTLRIESSVAVCCIGPTDIADLRVTGSASATNILAGNSVTLTLAVTNLGPDTVTNPVLTNTLPGGFALISSSSSVGTVSNAGNQVIFSFASLSNGATAELLITALATNSGTRTNLAVLTSSALDPNPTNNTLALVVTVPFDNDADGVADVWEILHGFSPTDPADALIDSDGDGHSNQQEYLAGTNPHDSTSFLRILSVTVVGADAHVLYTTAFDELYRVERTDDVASGVWVLVEDNIIGDGTNFIAIDPGAASQPQRTYRVRLLPQ